MNNIEKLREFRNNNETNNLPSVFLIDLIIEAILELNDAITICANSVERLLNVFDRYIDLNNKKIESLQKWSIIYNEEIAKLKDKQSKWVWNQGKDKKTNTDTGNLFYWDSDFEVHLWFAATNGYEPLAKFSSESEAQNYIDEVTR